MTFEKGMNVDVIALQTESQIVAKAMCEYLQTLIDDKEHLEVEESDLSMIVLSRKLEEVTKEDGSILYRVIMNVEIV